MLKDVLSANNMADLKYCSKPPIWGIAAAMPFSVWQPNGYGNLMPYCGYSKYCKLGQVFKYLSLQGRQEDFLRQALPQPGSRSCLGFMDIRHRFPT
jgi:hypothetical protein